MRKAIIINFIAKYSNVIIQLLLTMILARLVSPKEYGVIAVVTVFITFFNIIGDIGVAPAIVQYKDLDEKNYADIFKFMVLIALLLGLSFIPFSYGISRFYNNSIYIGIGSLLSLSIFLNLLSIVPTGILLKNKDFKSIGLANVLANLIAGIIAVLLAFRSFGVYALVANAIFLALFKFIFVYHYAHFKLMLRRPFNLESIKRISHFSLYQFLFNVVNYFTRNLDNLIVGKFLGVQPLGYYDKSYRLMLYPIQSLTFVVTPVLQPFLSAYQENKEAIFKYYMSIVKVLLLMGVFITAFCFFSARDIIYLMFGPNWLPSVDSFRILSLSIGIQMVLSSTGAIFQATDNTKYLFETGLISFICFTVLGFTGVLVGRSIEWVSFLLVVGFLLNFLQGYYVLVKKVFHMKMWQFFRYLIKPMLIQAVLFLAFYFVPINFGNSIMNVLVRGLYGLIIYVILLYVTGEVVYLRDLIRIRKRK